MRLLHLTGSPTSEFHADLSRVYARDCLKETGRGHEALIASLSPDGAWRFPVSLEPEVIAAAPAMALPAALAHIVDLAPDAMLPQLFCRAGMTHYRALFDVLGIAYPGNRPEVMALTADKAQARAVVAAAGVRVPEGERLRRGEAPTLAPPVVVKPLDADNSLGVSLVRDASAFEAALVEAFAHAEEVLVERYVELGREVRVGLLERDGELVLLPIEEYAVAGGIRGPGDKLGRTDGELALMAKDAASSWRLAPDDPLAGPVGELARRCHRALGCRHYSLFDVRIDPGGEPWFLEASLYCSFARQSVLAVMAQAAGIGPAELLQTTLKELDHGR